MGILKQGYKYLVVTIGGFVLLFSLFISINLDLLSKSGGGAYTDGFGNRRNPENGKAYWNITYLGQRAVQIACFFGGISIIGYGLELKKKENGAR